MLATTVDSPLDVIDQFDGVTTLREAILDANQNPNADIIDFDSTPGLGLDGGTILLTQGALPTITDSVTIDASMLSGITIDANDPTPDDPLNRGDGTRIFDIDGFSTNLDVTLIGLTLTGADSSSDGGAIFATLVDGDSLSLLSSTLDGNSAHRGAGVFVVAVTQSLVHVEDTTFLHNEALLGFGRDGGGIAAQISFGSTLTIVDSLFEENQADDDGAGLHVMVTDASVQIEESSFVNNTAGDKGGGVYLRADNGLQLRLAESTLSGNNSGDSGGGLNARLNGSSSLVIEDSKVSGNTASQDGGGVFARLFDSSSLVIEDSEVSGNTAARDGGGVFAYANSNTSNPFPTPRSITISRSLISGNTASKRGGGIYTRNFDGTETLVEDSRITGNHALDTSGIGLKYGNGGGIYAYLWDQSAGVNKPRFTISRSTVDNSDAENEGGGIFVCAKFFGEFVAINSTISGNRTLNTSSGRGGGIFIARYDDIQEMETVDAYLNNVTVTQNVSQSGGGVEMEDLDDVFVRINNSIISENFDDETKTNPNNLVGRVDIPNSQRNLVGTGSSVLDLNGDPAVLDPDPDPDPDKGNIISDSPMLSTLGFHGGLTPTHRLLQSSPAIDAGLNSLAENPLTLVPLQTDQRGTDFPRIFDVAVDIGAYEIGPLKVINVIISGSISTHDPFSFDTVDGSGAQLATVPVGGADTIAIVFSEDVDITTITQDSLRVLGLTRANLPTVADFNYNDVTDTATWRFENWTIYGDNYLISLTDAVTDVYDNPLDGEWVNPESIDTINSLVSEFPSGDGTPGGNFDFIMTLLPGDANLDGVVNGFDVNILAGHFGEMLNQLFVDADFNGDGAVTGFDVDMLAPNFGTNLQDLFVLADLNGDFDVDGSDLDLIASNFDTAGTYVDGDLNGDGWVDQADLDLAFAQFGLTFDWVA